MKRIYLDCNATTRVHPEVIEKMVPFFGEKYGNASSSHLLGQEAKKHVERARRQVGALINAGNPREIVFTSGGTEADNFAITRAAYANKDKGKHIVVSSVEHPAVLNTCGYLEKQGFTVTYLGVDKHGMIDMGELEKNLTKGTILVSVMTANNETGTILPAEKIGEIVKEKGIIFHTDAVQSLGKVPVDVRRYKADLVSLSAHKINGPKGVGALYVKKGTKIDQFLYGGHQEGDLRAGTENVPGIVGFGEACEISREKGLANYQKVKELRDKLFARIKKEIKNVSINGHPVQRLPNTLNISFKGLDGESIVLGLDLEGVAVSTGAACASGSAEPSHVLMNMGVKPEEAKGAVRFSLGVFNTSEDIDQVISKLSVVIRRMK